MKQRIKKAAGCFPNSERKPLFLVPTALPATNWLGRIKGKRRDDIIAITALADDRRCCFGGGRVGRPCASQNQGRGE
jgi:hypothetical protein